MTTVTSMPVVTAGAAVSTTGAVSAGDADNLIAALERAAHEAGRYHAETLDAAVAVAAARRACREAAAAAAVEAQDAAVPEPQEA